MKSIILLILVGLMMEQCFGKDGGHGHHHGHDHEHDHGTHGYDHGHHHGHDHSHHGHVEMDEHVHYNQEQQAAKFRYSKQANKDPVPEPVHHHGEEKAKGDPIVDEHKDPHGHNYGEGHSDGHDEGQRHSHGHRKGHGHSHEHGEGYRHSPGHDEGHGHSNGHKSHENAQSKSKEHKRRETVHWLEPLLATAMISAAPFLILFVVPLNNNSPESKPFLKVLLSFASGGLLGDAFLHLIPHAISPHSHTDDGGHGHSHGHTYSHGGEQAAHDHTGDMIVGLWVLGGIIAFLVVEKFVRFVKGGHGHSHGHSNVVPTAEPEVGEGTDKEKDVSGDAKNHELKAEEEDKTGIPSEGEEIKVAAYLNLAADCTHNFTDGLAIGASFLVSRNVGLITTLTIFLHEIPHEIGDFAILVQSGCTKRKAMLLQLVTAIGAFAGCICGLLAEGLGTAASSWILPFTAGGFIYIATVSVIPELLEETKLGQSIKEILGLLVGVFLMVIIALTE